MTAAVPLGHPLPPEERARAELYAVLARLYADAPDAEFLAALARSARLPEAPEAPLAAAWNRLADASAAMDAAAAQQEYADVFVGVGRSEVNLHGSHWRTGFMMEKPLAELRTELSRLGLARRGDTTRVEDHLSALCETMRILIAGGDDRPPTTLAVQGNFFRNQLLPWVFECCGAIERSLLANYYRRVAEFTAVFMAVERDSLAME